MEREDMDTEHIDRWIDTYRRTDSRTLHNVDNVVHHDVHATQLTPGLDRHAQQNALEHALGDKRLVAANRLRALKLEGVLDLLVLRQHLWIGRIAVVQAREDLQRLLPPVLGREPSRAVGQKEQANEEDHGREHLHAPRDAEGRCGLVGIVGTAADLNQKKNRARLLAKQGRESIRGREGRELVVGGGEGASYIGSTVLNKVLDQNTPGNSPLLQRDDATSDLLGRNLTLVDRHDTRGDTN